MASWNTEDLTSGQKYDERPYRLLVTPRACEWIRPTLTPIHGIHYGSLSPHESASQTAPDRFSRSCVHQQSLLMLFNGGGQPTKLPIPLGDRDHLTHGSLGTPELALQTQSSSVQPFCRAHPCAQHTQTDIHYMHTP